MKLQKTRAYTYGGKDYHKYIVTLPPEHVEQMGWEHGQELEAVPRKDGLLIRPVEEDE